MIFVLAFLFSGIVCLIGDIILTNTKLTPGHVTTLFSISGGVLSFLGLYDLLIKHCGAGATVLISNFGHLLYQASLEGFYEDSFLGIFTNMFVTSSAALSSVIIFSFTFSLIFRAKK